MTTIIYIVALVVFMVLELWIGYAQHKGLMKKISKKNRLMLLLSYLVVFIVLMKVS
jgi:hypothetical protein